MTILQNGKNTEYLLKRKSNLSCWLKVSADHRIETRKSGNIDIYSNLARGKKQTSKKTKTKTAEHEGNSDSNYNWCTWSYLQRLVNKPGGTGN